MAKVEWLLSFANAEFGDEPIRQIAAPAILNVRQSLDARERYEPARHRPSRFLCVPVSRGRCQDFPAAHRSKPHPAKPPESVTKPWLKHYVNGQDRRRLAAIHSGDNRCRSAPANEKRQPLP